MVSLCDDVTQQQHLVCHFGRKASFGKATAQQKTVEATSSLTTQKTWEAIVDNRLSSLSTQFTVLPAPTADDTLCCNIMVTFIQKCSFYCICDRVENKDDVQGGAYIFILSYINRAKVGRMCNFPTF